MSIYDIRNIFAMLVRNGISALRGTHKGVGKAPFDHIYVSLLIDVSHELHIEGLGAHTRFS